MTTTEDGGLSAGHNLKTFVMTARGFNKLKENETEDGRLERLMRRWVQHVNLIDTNVIKVVRWLADALSIEERALMKQLPKIRELLARLVEEFQEPVTEGMVGHD